MVDSVSSLTFSGKPPYRGAVVWMAKPWVIPSAIVRTILIVLFTLFLMFLEMYSGIAIVLLFGAPLYLWTLLVFTFIWIILMLQLLIFYYANSYILRQDGLEVRRGIVRLHSFVVTPSGFGDLMLYQGLGGRIFGYGDLTVNSQGERQTRLVYVRSPYMVADTVRNVMGKPIVRVDNLV
jgi:hypothetical protein